MTRAKRKLIGEALGANTLSAMDQATANPDRDSWTRLATEVTLAVFEEMQNSPPIAAMVYGFWLKAAYTIPPGTLRCDAYVHGRIGGLDLSRACYSFYEAWGIAVPHLVKTGRARQAVALLRAGVTVRELFRAFYGIKAGPEKDVATERRAFLRTLRREERANSNWQG